MKTQWLKLISLTVIIFCSHAAVAKDRDINKGDGETAHKETPKDIPNIKVDIDFKVVAPMPDVPSELPGYAVQHIDPTVIDPRKDHVANVFDFKSMDHGVDKTEDGAVSVMHIDPQNRSIEYFSSGAVFFMEQELFSERVDDILTSQNMDAETAKKMYREKSHDFLARNELFRPNMVFKDVSFANVKQMSVKSEKESSKVVGIAAHYGYEFDGIPAWGPGAKATLYFGENGISGFYNAAPQSEPTGLMSTIKPEEVISQYIEVGKPQSLLRLHAGVVEQVIIENIELVYYIDAGNKIQELITPHYLISGTFLGRDIADRENGEIEAEFQWLASAVH